MESCDKNSKITDESYQRIRNLMCQGKEPYKENCYEENNNHLFIVLLFFILILIFYQMGANNLSK